MESCFDCTWLSVLCQKKLYEYDWKWKAMLIQNNLTSGVIYAQIENTNNASCVFFHMSDICPINHELVRNHSPGND